MKANELLSNCALPSVKRLHIGHCSCKKQINSRHYKVYGKELRCKIDLILNKVFTKPKLHFMVNNCNSQFCISKQTDAICYLNSSGAIAELFSAKLKNGTRNPFWGLDGQKASRN